MSFGSKQYQHRFYTAPKVRPRHVLDFVSPQQSHQRYRSVTAFNPYPQSPLQESSMKESYLRLVNNGLNSRLYTKEQLGYEGLKFQKDVISRYCNDDYQKNSQILEKFRRQAEESKRSKKHYHLKDSYSSPNTYDNPYTHKEPITMNPINNNNQSISLLPITNSHIHHQNHHSSSPQRLLSIKNTQHLISPLLPQSTHNLSNRSIPQPLNPQNSRFLPALKLEKYLNSHSNQSVSGVIQQEEEHSHNQNQYQRQRELQYGQNDAYDREYEGSDLNEVCDVGINAHLTTIQSQQNPSKKRHSQRDIQQRYSTEFSHQRKKSESIRIETLKLKNKHMKKKYDKLKQQLMERSKLLFEHQHLEEDRQNLQKNQKLHQNYENLSTMINDLCNKLRQNNSKIMVAKEKIFDGEEMTESQIYQSRLVEKKPYRKSERNSNRDDKNHTQISLFKNTGLDQQTRAHDRAQPRQIKQNTEKWKQELEKLDSQRTKRPKIIYSLNKQQKNLKIDPLKLLKNRMKQQHFNIHSLKDYSVDKKGIPTTIKRTKTEEN